MLKRFLSVTVFVKLMLDVDGATSVNSGVALLQALKIKRIAIADNNCFLLIAVKVSAIIFSI